MFRKVLFLTIISALMLSATETNHGATSIDFSKLEAAFGDFRENRLFSLSIYRAKYFDDNFFLSLESRTKPKLRYNFYGVHSQFDKDKGEGNGLVFHLEQSGKTPLKHIIFTDSISQGLKSLKNESGSYAAVINFDDKDFTRSMKNFNKIYSQYMQRKKIKDSVLMKTLFGLSAAAFSVGTVWFFMDITDVDGVIRSELVSDASPASIALSAAGIAGMGFYVGFDIAIKRKNKDAVEKARSAFKKNFPLKVKMHRLRFNEAVK